MHWWENSDFDRSKPMVFPDRTKNRQVVITIVPERKSGDPAQPKNERVRVFV